MSESSDKEEKLNKSTSYHSANNNECKNNDQTNKQNTTTMKQIREIDSIICRICHRNDRTDRLISPCLCKGTLNYVHRACLEHWLSRANIFHCELCMHQFETNTALRYKCCQAIRIWFRHPNNRGLLQADLFICSIMTLITMVLIAMSVYGLNYFTAQYNEIGISKFWTQGTVTVFLIIVVSVSIAAFLVNVSFIFKAQITPWYRWWKSTKVIRLTIPNYYPSHENEPEHIEVIISR